MFPRNRPIGWILSIVFVVAMAMMSVRIRPAVGAPVARAPLSTPMVVTVVAPRLPAAVIGAARFIARIYRVPPVRARDIALAAFRVSQAHRLNPYLVLAVIAVESSFRPHVVNHYGGAYGLMQIAVRAHEKRVAQAGGLGRLFLITPNIRIGVALLAQYGARARARVRQALWRYSGGEYGYARKVLRLSAVLQRAAVFSRHAWGWEGREQL